MNSIAILATGDEITQGSVLNTNACNMAHELFGHGLNPQWQMVVPDDKKVIEEAITLLLKEHAVVITIGGLGPTSDDITRWALADSLKEPLVEDALSLEKITQRYAKLGLPLTKLSIQQALFPKNSEIFSNENGSANGCGYQRGEQSIFMLPGPPSECLPMFKTYVLPRLITKYATQKSLLQWKVFGIAEGVIAEKVDEFIQPYKAICRTSFRWEYPYVDCKILIDTEQVETIQASVDQLLRPYQLDPETNQTATGRLKNYLIETKKRVFIQDYATGGVFESRVRSSKNHLRSGNPSSESNEIFFHIDGLKNYWEGRHDEHAENQLVITSNKGVEKIAMPFRTTRLEEYAAELVAHHIFLHLIGF